VLIGGGEHARVVLDAARGQPEQWAVVGFVERPDGSLIVAAGSLEADCVVVANGSTPAEGTQSVQISRRRPPGRLGHSRSD